VYFSQYEARRIFFNDDRWSDRLHVGDIGHLYLSVENSSRTDDLDCIDVRARLAMYVSSWVG